MRKISGYHKNKFCYQYNIMILVLNENGYIIHINIWILINMQKELIKRKKPIDKMKLGYRSNYFRDYTAILHSKAFRRLRHKTQVFFFPENDMICTRLEHSLVVESLSRVVAKKLGFDEELCSAIALGHDLGHPPFGHIGEIVLNELGSDIGGFSHERHSLYICDKIERPPDGLNLTYAVRDGIVHHCGESELNKLIPSNDITDNNLLNDKSLPVTYEGCIVRICDKISYLGRDIEDAITAGFIEVDEIDPELAIKIGKKNGEIIDYFIRDLIETSISSGGFISLSDDASYIMNKLKVFNYTNIYNHSQINLEKTKIRNILKLLFNLVYETIRKNGFNYKLYNVNYPLLLLGKFIKERSKIYCNNNVLSEDKMYTRIAIDWISCFTDNYARDVFNILLMPIPII